MPDQQPRWQRSSKCEAGNCVEVALLDDVVLIRRSGGPTGPVLQFSTEEWLAFCAGIVDGELGAPVP